MKLRGRVRLPWIAILTLVGILLLPGVGAGQAEYPLISLSVPYHGVAGGNVSTWATGCGASVSNRTHWAANASQGRMEVFSSNNATSCGPARSSKFYTSYISADSYAYLNVDLPLIPKGSSTIYVGLGGAILQAVNLSDGTGRRNPTCPGGLQTASHNYTEWAWGWNGSSFAGRAYKSTIQSGNKWTNTSSNLSAIPSRFALSNTTAYYHNARYGRHADCSAYAAASFSLGAGIFDSSTGKILIPKGSPPVFDLDVLDEIGHWVNWYWINSSSWNGPGTSWPANSTVPTTFHSNNQSKETLYDFCQNWQHSCALGGGFGACAPLPPCSAGGYESTRRANIRSILREPLLGTLFSWTGPFRYHDNYTLSLSIEFSSDSNNDMPRGYASVTQAASVSVRYISIF